MPDSCACRDRKRGIELPRLLLGTNNHDKVQELRALLAGSNWTVLAPADLGLRVDIEENGDTYGENAALKARTFAHASGVTTLADDSGLEVDALGGRPGVFSSRYGGADAGSNEKILLLLAELRGVPEPRRTARFRCVIAIATPDSELTEFEGVLDGHIALSARGANGFGYDPVFLVQESNRTLAELAANEKDLVSHRAKAMRQALKRLDQLQQRKSLP